MQNELTVEELRAQPSARSLYINNLRRSYVPYALGTIAMLATSVSEVMIPKCIQWTIDALTPTADTQAKVPAWLQAGEPKATMQSILSVMAVLVAVGVIGRFSWRQFLARQTHYAGNRIKVGLWDVLRFQPMKTFERYPLGDLLNRAIGDWNAGRIIHGFTLVLSFDVIFFTGLALAAMLAIDWQITILSFVCFCIVPSFIMRRAKQEQVQHVFAQDRLSDLSDFISQNLRTIRLQRATHCEARWQQRLQRLSANYAQSRLAVLKTSWDIFPFATLPSIGAYGVLMLLGITKVQSGALSVGEFVAMTSFILLMQTPLFELGDCIAEWQRGFASMRRIAEIFRLESGSERAPSAQIQPTSRPGAAALEIKDLHFAYDSHAPVLRGINLRIETGERVGIAGEIGAGKSTLIKLISGMARPIEESVSLYGHDVAKLPRDWFARHVTVVPQHSFLFAGSIRDNLCLGMEVDDDAIWKMLDAVEIGEEVRNFPNQLTTWIGEWGINLSGGQKQRLAIARALLRPRPILLLDDCLSAVDAKKEGQIVQNLAAILEGMTVIWIAHRTSTLRYCTRNYELIHGSLREASLHSIAGIHRGSSL